jgi:hypothetical protein
LALEEGIMLKNLLLIILAGIFLGCSYTAGRRYDITAMDRIGVGQTTEGEVITLLGPPLAAKNSVMAWKSVSMPMDRNALYGLELQSIRCKYNFIMGWL